MERYSSKIFEPALKALSDTWLQARARPWVFLILWGIVQFVPNTVLSLVLGPAVLDASSTAISVLTSIGEEEGNVISLTPLEIQTMNKGARSMFFMFLFGVLTAVLLGSATISAVERIRNSTIPEIRDSLVQGINRFRGLLAATGVALFRAALIIVPGYIAAILIGSILGDPITIPIVILGMISIAVFFRYGLTPYIHMTKGQSGRDAVRTCLDYCKRERLVVAGLFLTALVIPLILTGILRSVIVSLGSGSVWVLILDSGLNSLALLIAHLIFTNFAFNTFSPTRLSSSVELQNQQNTD